MQNITIREIHDKYHELIDQDVRIKGWIKTLRSSKEFGFIEVSDGSFFNPIQIIFERSKVDNYDKISKFLVGASLKIEGKLVASVGNKQAYEINAYDIELLGDTDSSYPLQKKRHTREFLRTIAHLRPRTNLFNAVFRIRSLASYAIHSFFNERNFVYVHTPIITGSDCEGAGDMFKVTTLDLGNIPLGKEGVPDFNQDFFAKETSLTVSGQLNVENYCLAFRNVYTFGPTFRAENSNTPRHAAEFWMVEPEIAFADIVDDMNLSEDMIKYVVNYVRDRAPEEMEFFYKFVDKNLKERLDNLINAEFARISYTEAIDILLKANVKFEYPVKWGLDLQTEHERYLTEIYFKKPVFVIDWPKEIKAFYMRLNDDQKTVSAMDLLVPGVGEIIGGSQREEREDFLKKRIVEMGLNLEDYWWYLDLRKYGTCKHAGFGLGLERLIIYLTGVENIRDVIPFPRTPRNAQF